MAFIHCLEDNWSARQQRSAEEIRELQSEYTDLELLLHKRASLQHWRLSFLQATYSKRLNELQRRADRFRIDSTEIRLLAEEEILLLRQQQLALRKFLTAAENECQTLRTQLDNIVCSENFSDILQKCRVSKGKSLIFNS